MEEKTKLIPIHKAVIDAICRLRAVFASDDLEKLVNMHYDGYLRDEDGACSLVPKLKRHSPGGGTDAMNLKLGIVESLQSTLPGLASVR